MANGNPFFISPAASQGAMQGLGAIGSAFIQKQQQDQAQAAQQAAQQEIQGALQSGDVGQIQQVMLKYPQMAQTIEQSFGFSSEQSKQDMINRAFNILSGGRGVEVLGERAEQLEANGRDATQTREGMAMEPEELRQVALATIGTLGSAEQIKFAQSLQKARGPGADTTAKLTEFDRWAGMEPGPERDALANILGIRKQGKNTNIPTPTGYTVVDDAGNVVNTVEIPAKKQQFEAQQKQKEQALKAAERAEAERVRQADIAEMDYQESLEQTTNQSIRAFNLAGELLKPGFIDAATGTWDRLTPTLFKSTQDAINKGLELKNMLTLENLGLMTGVLTDKDIEVLSSAGSGLRVDEDGFIGSEDAVRAQIEGIQDQLEMRLKRAVRRGDLSQADFDAIVNPQEGRTEIVMDATGQPVAGATGQPQLSPFSSAGQAQQSMQEGRTATNPQTGQKMIFRNGQWVPVGG